MFLTLKQNNLVQNPLFKVALVMAIGYLYFILWTVQSSFLFLPTLILLFLFGNGIRRTFFIRENEEYKIPWFFLLLVNTVFGIMGVVLLTILLTVSYAFTETILRITFLALTFGVSLLAAIKIMRSAKKKEEQINSRTLHTMKSFVPTLTNVLVTLSIIFAFLAMVYIRSKESWPIFAGLDHFHYMPWVYKLLNERGLTNLFLQGGGGFLSIIAQPLSYYASIGAFLVLLNIHFLNLFFYGPFLILPLYAILVFTLGLKVFRNSWLAFFSVLLNLTVVGSGHFYGAHDLYSTSITQLLFLTLWLYFYLIRDKLGTREFLFAGVLYFLFFLLYPFTVIMNLPLLAFYIQNRQRQRKVFLVLIFIVIAGTMYAQGVFPPNWSLFDQIRLRWGLINISYSWFHLELGIVGTFLLTFQFIRKRIHSAFTLPIFFYSFLLIIFFWSGLPNLTIRFEWYWRTFYTLLATVPLLAMKETTKPRLRKTVSVIAIVVFLISQGMALAREGVNSPFLITRPTYIYREGQKFIGGAISNEELRAMQWLEKNTTPDDYIITDPYMGNLLRGTINRQSSSALTLLSGETPSIVGPYFTNLKIMNYQFLSSFRSNEDYMEHATGKLVKSNIQEDEKYSLGNGRSAKNLIDGSKNTLAYPASSILDYTVDIGTYVPVDRINIVWGEFGFPTNDGKSYVNRWRVDGKTKQGWLKITSGSIPHSIVSTYSFPRQVVNELRIQTSGENWHGIYEFSAQENKQITAQSYSIRLKKQIESELRRYRPTLHPRYILITPRMTYWLQYNELQNQDGTSNESLNNLPNWPILSTEVDIWDYEQLAKNLKWEISYRTQNIIIVKLP